MLFPLSFGVLARSLSHVKTVFLKHLVSSSHLQFHDIVTLIYNNLSHVCIIYA